MREEKHSVDFCVVGGGMAGVIAAIAAARHGARVALVQDRPVLGGNASSEIRMHICGAHGDNNRETGILEELLLENHYRNPQPNYSIWDSVVYGAVQYQKGLQLFLNCSVIGCTMEDNRIRSVRAWQLTTETHHTIEANVYADCSGDGILAPLSGAEFRIGREARPEFNESIAPVESDRKTMGMSCLLQAREYPTARPFIPPAWADRFTSAEAMRRRDVDLRRTNFWWMEVGGEDDSIHDTERLREKLLRISFGVWDYIKNYSPIKDELANWDIDWMGFLPGKRESRRYIGDHILTQNDIEAEGRFDDLVAYGGWTMDDHFPAGFYHPEAGTIFHPAPSPFGIPYRSLYSRNIANLFCAGRCHSATHAAMSATRVMATTSLMGQAVGTAAAIAVREGLNPRGVYEKRITELRETLMDDDVFLPWSMRAIPELTRSATLSSATGDSEALRNGIDRPMANDDNGWTGPLNSAIEFVLPAITQLKTVRLVFDSNLDRGDTARGPGSRCRNMRHYYSRNDTPWHVPETLVRSFRLDIRRSDGKWETAHKTANNYQRLVTIPLAVETSAIRIVPETTWGATQAHIFAAEVSD